jgi:hypothetical protein
LRYRLTREPAAHQVHLAAVVAHHLGRQCSDIVVLPHVWPVLAEHAAAVVVDLDLADNAHTCALKAKLEAADASE